MKLNYKGKNIKGKNLKLPKMIKGKPMKFKPVKGKGLKLGEVFDSETKKALHEAREHKKF